jgi:hypothetical protein
LPQLLSLHVRPPGSRLLCLELDGIRLGVAGIAAICAALSSAPIPPLQALSLNDCGITDPPLALSNSDRSSSGTPSASVTAPGSGAFGVNATKSPLPAAAGVSSAGEICRLLATPGCRLVELSLRWNGLGERSVPLFAAALRANTSLHAVSASVRPEQRVPLQSLLRDSGSAAWSVCVAITPHAVPQAHTLHLYGSHQIDLSWNRLGRSSSCTTGTTSSSSGLSTSAAALLRRQTSLMAPPLAASMDASAALSGLWSSIADHPALLHVALESCGLSANDVSALEGLVSRQARLLGCLHLSGNEAPPPLPPPRLTLPSLQLSVAPVPSGVILLPRPALAGGSGVAAGRVLSRLCGHPQLPGSELWRVAPACWLCDRWVEELLVASVQPTESAPSSSSGGVAPPQQMLTNAKQERVFVATSSNGWLLQEMHRLQQATKARGGAPNSTQWTARVLLPPPSKSTDSAAARRVHAQLLGVFVRTETDATSADAPAAADHAEVVVDTRLPLARWDLALALDAR